MIELIKVELSTSKMFCFILFYSMKALLKMMKNALYLVLKALFFLKIFNFLAWLFGRAEKNGLIRKIKLIRVRGWFFHHILCMIFQEKGLSCYILLTDLISYTDCLCFLRYWEIWVLKLFVSQALTS